MRCVVIPNQTANVTRAAGSGNLYQCYFQDDKIVFLVML